MAPGPGALYKMSTQLDRIETLLSRMFKQMNNLETKIDHALYEDGDDIPEKRQVEPDTQSYPKQNQFEYNKPSDILTEDIVKYGEQIGYRRYDGADADELRKFIVHILNHPDDFNSIEYEYAGYANKPQFDDLRLSLNTFHIINGAYRKKYGRAMPFRYAPGILYRYGNQLHWVWKGETK